MKLLMVKVLSNCPHHHKTALTSTEFCPIAAATAITAALAANAVFAGDLALPVNAAFTRK